MLSTRVAPLAVALALLPAAPAGAITVYRPDNADPALLFGSRALLPVDDVPAGTPVVVFADEFPFDGVEREVGRGTADSFGRVEVPISPTRNTSYRAVREDTGEGAARVVMVDLRKIVRFTPRGHAKVTVVGPPDALGSLRATLYYSRRTGAPLRVHSRTRLRRVNRWIAMGRLRYPGPSSGGVRVCLEEPVDNGFGPPPTRSGDCEFRR